MNKTCNVKHELFICTFQEQMSQNFMRNKEENSNIKNTQLKQEPMKEK